MYADDTQLYPSFKPDDAMNQSAAIIAMQNSIDDVKQWMLADKLKLNDGKTEFMIYRHKTTARQSQCEYSLCG